MDVFAHDSGRVSSRVAYRREAHVNATVEASVVWLKVSALPHLLPNVKSPRNILPKICRCN